MKETLRDRVRAILAHDPDQTYRQLIQETERASNAVRLAVAGLIQAGEVQALSMASFGRQGDRVTLRLTDYGRAHMQEANKPKVRAVTSSSTSDTEGHGEEDAPNPYQGACVPTFVRGTASFTCERRKAEVTHADCYDDHMNAVALIIKTSPCYRCKEGAAKREAYANA